MRDDLGAHATRANQGCQECLDALHVVVFEPVHEVELLFAHRQLVATLGRGEQAALLVDYGDLSRLHLGNARGHEVDDGLNLFLLEAPPGFQLDEYGRTGGSMIAYESGLTGHREMDARTLDGTQVGDRSREFGFQRVLVACVLDELADAKARILVDCSEAAAALGQALPSQLQARIADALVGNFDRVRARLNAIRDLGRIQGLGDLRLIPATEVRIQEAVARSARPQHDGNARGDRGGDADQQQERLEARGQSLRSRK